MVYMTTCLIENVIVFIIIQTHNLCFGLFLASGDNLVMVPGVVHGLWCVIHS